MCETDESGSNGESTDIQGRGKKHDEKTAATVGRKLQFIDLFSGCGGFTLGMERAGLRALAALDFNAQAITTFKANLPHVPHVPERDLTNFGPEARRPAQSLAGSDPAVAEDVRHFSIGWPAPTRITRREFDGWREAP